MNVSGKIIAFVHEYSYSFNGVVVQANNFSTTISNKDKEGNYSNAYMEVKFSKDIIDEYGLNTLEEGDCIDVDITDGFLSFRSYDNEVGQHIVYQIVVTAVNDICEHVKGGVPFTEKPAKKAAVKKAAPKKSLKK